MRIKLLLITLCAAMAAVVNLQATTFQVQVGPGGSFTFSPATVSIQVGDTVQWNWADNGHSTTSGTPGNPDGLWDSGIQNTGATFSQTFNTAGSFPYFCSPHGACCNMVGTVVVSGSTSLPPIEKGTLQLK